MNNSDEYKIETINKDYQNNYRYVFLNIWSLLFDVGILFVYIFSCLKLEASYEYFNIKKKCINVLLAKILDKILMLTKIFCSWPVSMIFMGAVAYKWGGGSG